MEKMKLKEFQDKYCQDILTSARKREDLLPEIDFTFDKYLIEEDGEAVKAIEVGDYLIPIRDILSLSERDFVLMYPDNECIEARNLYLENFIIIEGEEVLEIVRRQFLKSMNEIEKYSTMKLEDMI